MLINSLAALALGFALDMLLGDPEVVVYPQYFIKKLVAKLDKSFSCLLYTSDAADE